MQFRKPMSGLDEVIIVDGDFKESETAAEVARLLLAKPPP